MQLLQNNRQLLKNKKPLLQNFFLYIGYNAKAPISNTIKLGDDNVTDVYTNSNCRISGGFLGLDIMDVSGLASVADVNAYFNNDIAGTIGDIRMVRFLPTSAPFHTSVPGFLMFLRATDGMGALEWLALEFYSL